jgi:uncharacterized membrane protein
MILNEKTKRNIENNFIPNANALLIFILIISGNYLDDLLPCKVQTLMRNNLIMKHLVAFMILYFLTVLTIPELKSIKGIISAIGLYTLFLLSTKINYIAWAIMLFIYAIVYLMNIAIGDLKKKINKSTTKEERELKEKSIITMRRIMSWLVIVNMVIIVVGFIYYFGMKKMQHGNKFSLQQFFFDVPICGYTISKNKTFKPFIRAFKS